VEEGSQAKTYGKQRTTRCWCKAKPGPGCPRGWPSDAASMDVPRSSGSPAPVKGVSIPQRSTVGFVVSV